LLNRELNLVISNAAPAAFVDKKPNTADFTDAQRAASGFTTTMNAVIAFPTVQARPRMDRVNVNFAIAGFASTNNANDPGRWTLATREGTAVNLALYEINTVFGSTARRATDLGEWGAFANATEAEGIRGIAVLELPTGGARPRADRTAYWIRLAPVQATLTPASAPRRVQASSELAPIRVPRVRPVRGTTDRTMALRQGQHYFVTSAAGVAGVVVRPEGRPEPIGVSTGQVYTIWTAATARRPASQPIEFTIPRP
jgi:hypothetical protein